MNIDFKLSRRQFLKGAAVAGAAVALPLKFSLKDAQAFYQSPTNLRKFVSPLRGIETIPVAAADGVRTFTNAANETWNVLHYTIEAVEFTDQLHPDLGGPTKLWGYKPTVLLAGSSTPKHLGGIIVANRGTPVQITFRNKLPSKPIIPPDVTLGMSGLESAANRIAIHLHGGFIPWISDGGPFDWWGPTGTHGLSFLNNQVLNPSAAANEAEYYYNNAQSARLMWYHDHAHAITRTNAYAGLATAYILRDTFEASLIGDSTTGNPNGKGLPNYIELGGNELPIVFQDKIFVDSSTIGSLDPTWVQKGFPSTSGSIWYAHVYERSRWQLLGAGRNLPNPSCIPEFFGDTPLVNGTAYPEAHVKPEPYRLRILNACQAKFMNLQLYEDNGQGEVPIDPNTLQPDNTAVKGPDFLVIGNEGGFLKQAALVQSNIPFSISGAGVPTGSLITGSAERWDVVIDFSKDGNGNPIVFDPLNPKKYILYTDAPSPFPSGDPRNDYFYVTVPTANPNPIKTNPGFGPNTRTLMRFSVDQTPTGAPVLGITPGFDFTNYGIDPFLADPMTADSAGIQPTPIPNFTGTPWTLANGVTVNTIRRLTLNEEFDSYGRLIQLVGTNTPFRTTAAGSYYGRPYLSQATEKPTQGDVEIWEIANLTGDTHPMHIHLVNAQILCRIPFNATSYTGTPVFTGLPRPPDATELGWKETFRMNPGEVIYLIMKFDLPTTPFTVPNSPRPGINGQEYVWHCHILEHEEHDMMHALVVTPKP